MQNMLTNDVAALRSGHGCHAAKLDLQGKIIATLHVLRQENELWLDLEPGPAQVFEADLRKRIVLENAELTDMTSEWSLFGVQGPHAGDCLAAAGIDVSGLDKELHHLTRPLGSHWVHVVRSDHCGSGGFDVWVPAGEASEVWRLLVESRAQPVGLTALNVRRIEAGIPWHGRELTPDRFPQEAGLDEGWISYTKGCYLGQETISRLHHMGHVNRILRGLHLEAPDVPGPGTQLFEADKLVGWITSAARSPVLERVVALAFVRRESASPGTRVRVASPNGHAGEVTSLPMA
jgi:folate-binding protein YgfZ